MGRASIAIPWLQTQWGFAVPFAPYSLGAQQGLTEAGHERDQSCPPPDPLSLGSIILPVPQHPHL